jgi:hypothetical protein
VAVFRQYYGVKPGEATILLIGKDGGVKLRRETEILGCRELFATIDVMPMRRREMREQDRP